MGKLVEETKFFQLVIGYRGFRIILQKLLLKISKIVAPTLRTKFSENFHYKTYSFLHEEL